MIRQSDTEKYGTAQTIHLTPGQARAAQIAIAAMLSGEGPGNGDWPKSVSTQDMEDALAVLQSLETTQ